MSCCTVKKQKTSSSIKEFDLLKNHFDIVELEDKDKYRLLTLKDKTKSFNSDIDWIVWLQVKVSYGYQDRYTTRDDNYMLEQVCKKIYTWIDILKNFDKNNQTKQLSLFADEIDENELEPEPQMPTTDGGWSKYHKECEDIRKRNLMKQYSFFELLDIEYYTYSGIDYRSKLPTIEGIREKLKQAIIKGTNNPGRYDEFWFDYPSYLTRDGGLSDIELKIRLRSIRLFLVPYTSPFKAWTDDSYSLHTREESIDYRFYLDGERLTTCGPHDNDKLDLPTYNDLYNLEFLDWVRNTLNIPYKEVISDDDILRENLRHYFNSLLWYGKVNYDFVKKIQTFQNWKQFKTDINLYLKINNIDSNGGGSAYSLDGFSGNYSKDKKGQIKITQKQNERISLNRNVDLPLNDYGEYIIYDLTGDEIYKKAFELLNEHSKNRVQTSLFDFMELAS
jgi:hypothetical protein